MKKRKNLIAALVVALFIFSAMPVYAEFANVSLNSLNINVNNVIVAQTGESYTLEDGTLVPCSLLYNGTTYLPMRKIAEFVGKSVTWDQSSKTAAIVDSSATVAPIPSTFKATSGTSRDINASFNRVRITVDDLEVAKSGDFLKTGSGLSVPYSILYNNTTYLPMRKIAELTNKWVCYDGAERMVIIMDPVASYKDYEGIPDFGLLCDLPINSVATEEILASQTGWCYDTGTITGADIHIFTSRLIASGYTFVEPQTDSEPSAFDLYLNLKTLEAVSLGFTTDADGNEVFAIIPFAPL